MTRADRVNRPMSPSAGAKPRANLGDVSELVKPSQRVKPYLPEAHIPGIRR
jgi:hypothetical protein